MHQDFLERLNEIGYDKKALTALLNDLDAEKRSIKSRLSQLSSEPKEGDPTGRDRQTLIRRMKDKSSFLTEEREIVRERLGQIKVNQTYLNKAKARKPDFCEAFMAASEALLDEERFNEIEARAQSILEQT